MLNRNKDSHKGDNGRVVVIGGSETFYGAPILCALGAEYSGADLIHLFLPPCHKEAAKAHSLNFIIHEFAQNILTSKDVKPILTMCEKADTVVIGPGLGNDPKTQEAVISLLAQIPVPTVADADALIYANTLPKTVVLTPHRGEFIELTGDEPTASNIQKWAKNLNATILCKGPLDIIANADGVSINDTGNPLMTVGGTGDVLAGLIGGLIAQHMSVIEACKYGVKILCGAADHLAGSQGSLRAVDVAKEIPFMLQKIQ
jgi:hydroxyethylthiazole kinase-like uncharacterized protein yjeF